MMNKLAFYLTISNYHVDTAFFIKNDMERTTIAHRLSKLKRNHLFQCQPLTDDERDVLNAAIMELRKTEFKQSLHKK